jgi:hypothetical protein
VPRARRPWPFARTRRTTRQRGACQTVEQRTERRLADASMGSAGLILIRCSVGFRGVSRRGHSVRPCYAPTPPHSMPPVSHALRGGQARRPRMGRRGAVATCPAGVVCRWCESPLALYRRNTKSSRRSTARPSRCCLAVPGLDWRSGPALSTRAHEEATGWHVGL